MMRTSEPPHSRAMRQKIRPLAAASGRALLFTGLLMATFAPARPEQERVVNFYNWSDYIDPTILDSFTAETGIKVRYDTFDSNDTLEAKLLAGKSGYDVVVPSGYFLARQIAAGIFRKLDKSKLPNLVNAWPEIAARLASYDPGNQYAVNYMWGTTGIGYNVDAIRALLGGGGAIDSWDEIFDPAKISRFKDCGIHFLDSSDDIMPAALHYLQLDPNSSAPDDLQRAADLLLNIRGYIRKFHSSEYLNALASGEICLAVGFSGDIIQARRRAAQAKAGAVIAYAIPKEGAQLWFDNLAIPSDAPDVVEAHALIDYLLRAEVAAANSNLVAYANGNLPSQKYVNKTILEDRNVYPDATTTSKLYTIMAHDQKTQRFINRLWTRIKTGH
jgi:putrescine transport system substrate-binding protein